MDAFEQDIYTPLTPEEAHRHALAWQAATAPRGADIRIRAASAAHPYSDRTATDERVALAGLVLLALCVALCVAAVVGATLLAVAR